MDVLVIETDTARPLPPETPVVLELQTQGAALVPADRTE
jgi:hypothetical protein